jgi:hypothetical protein
MLSTARLLSRVDKGHDAWVVGDDYMVLIDISGMQGYVNQNETITWRSSTDREIVRRSDFLTVPQQRWLPMYLVKFSSIVVDTELEGSAISVLGRIAFWKS